MEDRRVKFLKPAYLICTIIFLAMATLCNGATTVSLALNLMLRPPLNFFFSMPVMILWNIFCIISCLVCITLWAVQIHLLDENLSIQETLRYDNTYDFKLVICPGSSYYCVVAVLLIHFVMVNLLNYDAAKDQGSGLTLPVPQV